MAASYLSRGVFGHTAAIKGGFQGAGGIDIDEAEVRLREVRLKVVRLRL